MTDVLLDTHTFLWALREDRKLSPKARGILAQTQVSKSLSLASVWEMTIKSSLGKLKVGIPLELAVLRARSRGLNLLPIDLKHVLRVETLPWHHRDPFDRLLIAQSLTEDLPILSQDGLLDQYGVRRIW